MREPWVFLGYASRQGQALIDREVYRPKAWTDHRPRCAAAAVPEEVSFATKPDLARRMIKRAGPPDDQARDGGRGAVCLGRRRRGRWP